MMKMLPIRLTPGQDLRGALEAAVASRHCKAAVVVSGIGSLGEARVRFAGADVPLHAVGALEILSLAGTIAPGASHLHAALANRDGEVFGGHVSPGCIVRTTAEVLVALLDDWAFTREPDPATGYDELAIRHRPGP